MTAVVNYSFLRCKYFIAFAELHANALIDIHSTEIDSTLQYKTTIILNKADIIDCNKHISYCIMCNPMLVSLTITSGQFP